MHRQTMPAQLPYDSRLEALIHPGEQPCVFQSGTQPELAPSRELLASECSRLAYLLFESDRAEEGRLRSSLARVGFNLVAVFNDVKTGSQAFAALRAMDNDGGAMALVAFRGTEPKRVLDWVADLLVWFTPWPPGGRVHRGFARAVRPLIDPIAAWLAANTPTDCHLLVTGHSLGAALATLAATCWPRAELVTIGSPKVGDAAFAALLAPQKCTRIVDGKDLVTELPPGWLLPYVHVGELIQIAADGSTSRDASAVGHRPGWGEAIVAAGRRLMQLGLPLPRRLTDHSPINYVRAFLP